MATNVTYIIGSILAMVVGLSILLYGPIVSGYVIKSSTGILGAVNDSDLNDTVDNIKATTWDVYGILGVVFIFIAIGLLLLGLMGGFAPVLRMVNQGFG